MCLVDIPKSQCVTYITSRHFLFPHSMKSASPELRAIITDLPAAPANQAYCITRSNLELTVQNILPTGQCLHGCGFSEESSSELDIVAADVQ